MLYIKLDENMNLGITVNEPIYRGDRMNNKAIFLLPLTVGDIDVQSATVYLSYIRADGTADISLLTRMEEKYNERYYQYTMPITSTLTRYAGEICSWIQIYAGSPRNPMIAKSGECILRILDSRNMDEYISDRNLSLIYEMQRSLEDKIDTKADSILFSEGDASLQLTSNGVPIGDKVAIVINNAGSLGITGAEVTSAGELVLTFKDGSIQNLGAIKGEDNTGSIDPSDIASDEEVDSMLNDVFGTK